MRFARLPVVLIAVLALLVGAAPLLALTSCDYCGALNSNDAARCTVCGRAVGKAAAPPSPSPHASPSSSRKSPKPDVPPPTTPKALPSDAPIASVPANPAPSIAAPAASPPVASPPAAASPPMRAAASPEPRPAASALALRPAPSPEPSPEAETESPAAPDAPQPPPAVARETGPKPGVDGDDEDSGHGAVLVLDSVPSGATVRIRGREVGETPLRTSLSPGFYRIALSKTGYDVMRFKVRMRSGQTERKRVELDEDSKLADTPAIEDDVPAKVRRHEGHEQAIPSPSALPEPLPTPSAPIEFSDPPAPPRSGQGTFAIELVHYGDHTLASTFTVEIDGTPAGKGHLIQSELSARMVHVLRYTRPLPAGAHHVRLTLLGVPTIKGDGTLQEAWRDFDVMVSAGRNTTLYHTWPGGIEEFAKSHACCDRGHKK